MGVSCLFHIIQKKYHRHQILQNANTIHKKYTIHIPISKSNSHLYSTFLLIFGRGCSCRKKRENHRAIILILQQTPRAEDARSRGNRGRMLCAQGDEGKRDEDDKNFIPWRQWVIVWSIRNTCIIMYVHICIHVLCIMDLFEYLYLDSIMNCLGIIKEVKVFEKYYWEK